MLLAGLQRQAVCRAAQTVLGGAYDAAGQEAFVFVAGGHKADSGASEAHRQAEALCAAYRDVGTPRGRLLEDCQGEQVAIGGDQHTAAVRLLAEGGIVADFSVCSRILQDGAKAAVLEDMARVITDFQFDAQSLGARLKHRKDVGEDVCVDKQQVAAGGHCFAGAQVVHHTHRLRRGGGIVQHRAVCQVETGQRGYHRLEYHQSLQTALRYLGLVRRVRSVPGRVLKDVALNHTRGGGAVPAHSDERCKALVCGGDVAQAAHLSGTFLAPIETTLCVKLHSQHWCTGSLILSVGC